MYYQNMTLETRDIEVKLMKGYKSMELELKHYGNHIGAKQVCCLKSFHSLTCNSR